MNFLRTLVKYGFHGKRHGISKIFVDVKSWEEKAQTRIDKLNEWAHNNGIGV